MEGGGCSGRDGGGGWLGWWRGWSGCQPGPGPLQTVWGLEIPQPGKAVKRHYSFLATVCVTLQYSTARYLVAMSDCVSVPSHVIVDHAQTVKVSVFCQKIDCKGIFFVDSKS